MDGCPLYWICIDIDLYESGLLKFRWMCLRLAIPADAIRGMAAYIPLFMPVRLVFINVIAFMGYGRFR